MTPLKKMKLKKISDSIKQAISQLKISNIENLSVETPSWIEPLVTTKAPASVMTCMLYETMAGLADTDSDNKLVIHYKSGSLRDQIVITKLNGKLELTKEHSNKIQNAISNANSFAFAYDVGVKLLAGTGNIDFHIVEGI